MFKLSVAEGDSRLCRFLVTSLDLLQVTSDLEFTETFIHET